MIGRLGVELMAMRVAFVLTLIGLVLLLLGRRSSGSCAFPLLFLFLMVPLPQSLVNVIAFPLQLIAADFAVELRCTGSRSPRCARATSSTWRTPSSSSRRPAAACGR